MNWLLTLAQASGQAAQPGGQPDAPAAPMSGGMLPLIMILGIVAMYFLMFRPQRKQEKKRKEMLAQIAKNDQVVTIGGIKGIVYSVGDDDVVLKIDERNDVRIRVTKSAVAHILTEDEVKSGAESEKKAE